MPITPVIAIFHKKNVSVLEPLRTDTSCVEYEATEIESLLYQDDSDLNSIIVKHNPHLFITFGDIHDYPVLLNSPLEVRRRWIHLEEFTNRIEIGNLAYSSYMNSCTPIFYGNEFKKTPLISLFTPAYKTGDRIWRVYQSIIDQTYNNWEWVLYDDSDDNGETFKLLSEVADRDHRIKVFKSYKPSGIVGETKRRAAMLCTGEYLIEMDHDDTLTDYSLDHINQGFQQFPDGGFLYTDNAEVLETGGCIRYGKNWGHGYGNYREVEYKGAKYAVVDKMEINHKTIRTLYAAPNHIRAWRSDFYHSIGGHNTKFNVVDDLEILMRSFLNTKFIHVPTFGYIQWRNAGGNNTQTTRNSEIQRLMRYTLEYYDKAIHNRFIELGVPDYCWNETIGRAELNSANPEITEYANYIATI